MKVLTRNKLKTIKGEMGEFVCLCKWMSGVCVCWWGILVISEVLMNGSGNWCILLFSAN